MTESHIKPSTPLFKDLTKQRFGRLLVVEYRGARGSRSLWFCRCRCGNEKVVEGPDLTRGRTQSCGCLRRAAITKHGLHHHPAYVTYNDMEARCYNSRHKFYRIYGGRGITICSEWHRHPDAFIAWFDKCFPNGKPKGLTLDRKENDGPYSPENCRWVTHLEQQNHKRNNHFLNVGGRAITLAQLARECGCTRERIYYRLRHGWPIEKIVAELHKSNSPRAG